MWGNEITAEKITPRLQPEGLRQMLREQEKTDMKKYFANER